MKFKVELDFKDALKEAGKAAGVLTEALNKAGKSGLGDRAVFGAMLRGNLNQVQKFEAEIARTRTKLNNLDQIRQIKDTDELYEYRAKKEKELDGIRTKLRGKLSASERAASESERKNVEGLIQATKDVKNNSVEFSENLQTALQELVNTSRQADKLAKRLDASAEAANEIKEAWGDLSLTSPKLGEKITGLAEDVGDAFKDGIDVQSLARSLGQGTGKWITKGLQAVGGGGAGMMAMAGAIGGLVAGLGLLLAAFIAVDKKVKDFNKNLIKTHGAFAIARLGGGNLNRGLQTLRRTMMDLSGNLGVSQEEAEQLFDALDKGGIPLERIVRGTRDAARQQEMLSASLRGMYAAANAAGVGLSEYADNLTNYVTDLGMSVDSVNESFSSIADMAAQSAFGTRRFYSMVVQATSGQSALNVSLEQTGDLLMRMSKIMGQKKAAEMVGGAAGEFAGMGATERMKNVLIAGRGGRRVFQREAVEQTRTFARVTAGRGPEATAGFAQALERAGLTGRGLEQSLANAQMDPQDFVKRLGALNQRDQRALIAELGTMPGMEDMARQLDSLVGVTRASRGGFDAMVNSVQELSAGGALAFKAAEVRRIMGDRSIEEMSAVQRAAIENITGMSGQALDSFASMVRRQTGVFEQLQRRGRRGFANEEERKRFAELGVTLNEQGQVVAAAIHRNEQGVIDSVTATSQVIHSGDEMLQLNAESLTKRERSAQERAMDTAMDTMDATVSIADILENKVFQAIQSVYDVISGPILDIMSHIPGIGDIREKITAQANLAKEIGNQIRQIDEAQSGRASRRTALREQLREATTPEQKRALETQIRQAREEQTQADQRRQALMAARGRVTRGEFTPGRVGETRYEAVGARQVAGLAARAAVPFAGEGVGGLLAQHVARGGLGAGQATGVLPTYRTRKEAEAAAGRLGTVREVTETRAQTQQEMLESLLGGAPGVPAAAAPVVPAAAGPAAPAAAPTPRQAEVAQAPAVDATESLEDRTQRLADRTRRETRQVTQRQSQDMAKLLEGRTLGNGLAESRLPDAIAEADAKMRLLESLEGGFGRDPELVGRLLSGTATAAEAAGAGVGAPIAQALRSRHMTAAVEDFVYRDRGGRATITPISREDQVVGMRPGGPMAGAMGRGGGGNIIITINGGDERRVFDVVRRAIQQAGITPNRVPGTT